MKNGYCPHSRLKPSCSHLHRPRKPPNLQAGADVVGADVPELCRSGQRLAALLSILFCDVKWLAAKIETGIVLALEHSLRDRQAVMPGCPW